MIKICYIYKNEITMFRAINRMKRHLGEPEHYTYNINEKIFKYTNIDFVFLRYPLLKTYTGLSFTKIYLERSLYDSIDKDIINEISERNKEFFSETDGFISI